jgi:phosphatidylethanolamine-binding protein (PEBP) family uncharacterized protein
VPAPDELEASARRVASRSRRYFFRLHALDVPLDVGFRSGRRVFDQALAGHVLATAELVGTFER